MCVLCARVLRRTGVYSFHLSLTVYKMKKRCLMYNLLFQRLMILVYHAVVVAGSTTRGQIKTKKG